MRITLLAALLTLSLLPCRAQTIPWTEPSTPGQWNFRLGAMAFESVANPGSSQKRFVALPVFSADYDGRFFLGSSLVSVGAGAGVRLFRGTNLTWDLGLGVGEKRPESRADELAGMGDRSGDAFFGTGLRLHGGALHASLKIATGLVRDSGARATLEVGVGGRVASRLMAGFGLSGIWGTSQNLAWDFGVTPEQAASRHQLILAGDPRLRAGEDRPYAPGGGLRETNATAHLALLLPKKWQMFWVLRGTALQGSTRQSPLVRRDNYLTCGMGCSVKF